MEIKLKTVEKSEFGILRNLMSLYLHDMTEFADFLSLHSDGSYHYQNLGYYCDKEELSAYFIQAGTNIIGFILSNRPPYIPDDRDLSIQEFFILRKYRGKGYGRAAALEFFRQFPGRYLVAQLAANKPAIDFWHRLYHDKNISFEERTELDRNVEILTQRFTI